MFTKIERDCLNPGTDYLRRETLFNTLNSPVNSTKTICSNGAWQKKFMQSIYLVYPNARDTTNISLTVLQDTAGT